MCVCVIFNGYCNNLKVVKTFREQIDVVCSILKSLFPILDPASVVTELSPAVQASLNHPNTNVKLLALNQVSTKQFDMFFLQITFF